MELRSSSVLRSFSALAISLVTTDSEEAEARLEESDKEEVDEEAEPADEDDGPIFNVFLIFLNMALERGGPGLIGNRTGNERKRRQVSL